MKKLFNIILAIALCLSLAACGGDGGSGKEETQYSAAEIALVSNPTKHRVMWCLEDVDNITAIETDVIDYVSEGECTYRIYFSLDAIDQSVFKGETPVEKGIDCGGCIEIYSSPELLDEREQSPISKGQIYEKIGSVILYLTTDLDDESREAIGQKIISSLMKEEEIIAAPWKYYDEDEIFIFGSYEQDNNLENGPEPIEWVVLEKDEESVALLSVYSLDCQQFSGSSWESSLLCEWLNNDFYNSAFSEEEQQQIAITIVSNQDRSQGFLPKDVLTSDKVFSLAKDEFNYYDISMFHSDGEPTEYALAQGADINEEWWFRSQDWSSVFADAYNYRFGTHSAKTSVSSYLGVRPAICLYVDAELQAQQETVFLPSHFYF